MLTKPAAIGQIVAVDAEHWKHGMIGGATAGDMDREVPSTENERRT
jgi:hypothetical protein